MSHDQKLPAMLRGATVALGGVDLRLCVACARAVADWLSADLKVGCRQRGDYGGDFERTEKLVRTNLKMLRLLGVEPTDEELGSLMAHARGL